MKYISLDIETTGLNKDRHQIIQIAAVVDDLSRFAPLDSLPKFSAFVKWDTLQFDEFALGMHVKSGLLGRLFADTSKKGIDETILNLTAFLEMYYPIKEKEKYNVGGKNVAGFDIPFIRAAGRHQFPGAGATHIRLLVDSFSHRVIDPAVYFTDFVTDKAVANLELCKQRAGIGGTVSHDALDDALDVVKVVRHIAKENSCYWIPTNNA